MMTERAFDAMADELCSRLLDDDWESWTDAELQRRAVTAFAHQFEACPTYRAFCERRGVTPGTVGSWEDIPAVPATAFKYFDFVSTGGGARADGVDAAGGLFRTSGTTRGSERRGRHHVPRLDLYRASLLGSFRRALLSEVPGQSPDVPPSAARPSAARPPVDPPDAVPGPDPASAVVAGSEGSVPFVSLVPAPAEAPDSSLSFMVGAAAERFATEVHWLVGADGGWRAEAAEAASAELRRRGRPALLLGTALAFWHLVEARRTRGPTDAAAVARALSGMPEGSRVMETGGFKGARRRVSRDELYAGIGDVTGVPAHRIVNEYGMTELLSQLYEPVLTEGPEARGLHVPPPWLRVRALDPTALRPVAEGEDGILAFFDLANLGSVCHVLTEDVGALEGGRVRLKGRVAGAEPRGCSRAMDDLMSAAGRSPGMEARW